MKQSVVSTFSLKDRSRAQVMKHCFKYLNKFEEGDGVSVTIKPNLCRAMKSTTGATTDSTLVEAVIKYLLDEKAISSIKIVESDSVQRTAEEVFDRCGYRELEEKYNVKCVNLSKDDTFPVEDVSMPRRLRIPKTLVLSDYFISIAKLKTHAEEKISCVLKNQFGCIPSRIKSVYHPYMSETLTEVNKIIKPDVCLVDGIIGMEGLGPTKGTPKKSNLIICGNDPVATDAVAAKTMGLDPHSVPHLEFAAKQRIGNIEHIKLLGDEITPIPFSFIPNDVYNLYRLEIGFERVGQKIHDKFTRLSQISRRVGDLCREGGWSYVFTRFWNKIK
ncbi:MAG: DUF362 domain-containing protein [Promethearchaeota archaeon]